MGLQRRKLVRSPMTGLSKIKLIFNRNVFRQENIEGSKQYLRPCSIDSDDSSWVQAIRVGILNVGDIPPDLVDSRKHRWRQDK